MSIFNNTEDFSSITEQIENANINGMRADFGDDHPGISAITTHLS